MVKVKKGAACVSQTFWSLKIKDDIIKQSSKILEKDDPIYVTSAPM